MATKRRSKTEVLLQTLRSEARRRGISQKNVDDEIAFLVTSVLEGAQKGGRIAIIYHDSYHSDVPIERTSADWTITTLIKRIRSMWTVITTENQEVTPRCFKNITVVEETLLLPTIFSANLTAP